MPEIERIGVVGYGKMGQSIINGLLKDVDSIFKGQKVRPKFICSVSSSTSAASTGNQNDLEIVFGDHGNAQIFETADLILLCTKPHIAKTVFEGEQVIQALRDRERPLFIISILAGVTLHQLRSMITTQVEVDLIRAMPNTASRIQQGMTVLCIDPVFPVSDALQQLAVRIFSCLGRCRILDEKYIDVCTSLAASGPAFACVMLDALADGGVSMGLQRHVALELAAQAMQGACQLYLQTGTHPALLKDEITTPAGCTIAGLLAMEEGNIRSTLAKAVQAATKSAASLGQKPSNK